MIPYLDCLNGLLYLSFLYNAYTDEEKDDPSHQNNQAWQ